MLVDQHNPNVFPVARKVVKRPFDGRILRLGVDDQEVLPCVRRRRDMLHPLSRYKRLECRLGKKRHGQEVLVVSCRPPVSSDACFLSHCTLLGLGVLPGYSAGERGSKDRAAADVDAGDEAKGDALESA